MPDRRDLRNSRLHGESNWRIVILLTLVSSVILLRHGDGRERLRDPEFTSKEARGGKEALS